MQTQLVKEGSDFWLGLPSYPFYPVKPQLITRRFTFFHC